MHNRNAFPQASTTRDSARFQTISLDVDEKVLALGLTGVYFVMGDLRNRPNDSRFDQIRGEVMGSLASQVAAMDFKEDPILAGFRDLHTAVGRSNRDNIASPENLLRLLRKNGDLPSINLLVDIYNLVSLKTRLALGAHDLAMVDGNIHLRLTTGKERFVPLGSAEAKPIHPGEYGYVDDADDIICRMEVRQVEKTKVGIGSTECFYIVQGNAATESSKVWSAAYELIELTKEFCGGNERILFGP